MKRILLFIIVVFTFFSFNAQSAPKLQFKNGTLKIVQFTDTHIALAEKHNLQVYETVQKVLAAEKPEILAKLQATYDAWNAEQAPPSAPSETATKKAAAKKKGATKKAAAKKAS